MPSAAIAHFRYRDEDRTLVVRFQRGGEYAYAGVPREVHRAFRQAPSKGRFFQDRIRDRYPYCRLDDG